MSPGVEAPFVVPLGHVSSFFVCPQLRCCRRSVDLIPSVRWLVVPQFVLMRSLPACVPQKSFCKDSPGRRRSCPSSVHSLSISPRCWLGLVPASSVAVVSSSWACLPSLLVSPPSQICIRWRSVPPRHSRSMLLPVLGCWPFSSCRSVMCVLEFRRIHTPRCCCLSVHFDIHWLYGQPPHT